MLEKSILKSSAFGGGVKNQSTLKPKKDGSKKTLIFTLTLTSLIDAFTIIVIYLLVNFGNPSQNLKLQGNIQLPQATQNEEIKMGTVVSIAQGHYFIEDREVSQAGLSQGLAEMARSKPDSKDLIIQADKQTGFDVLSPVIAAGSQAGFHQFKFAVLQGGKSRP